jgi:thiamine-monophosphate kinase
MVRRGGLRVGDRIVVSGTIGDAALGLDVLQGRLEGLSGPERDFLVGRYRVPQPRTALALAVRDHASAAMDVSDGLVGDLSKMCAASGVSATIDATAIPLSQPGRAALASGKVGIERLVAGGDDYEILCGVAEDRLDSFMAAAGRAGIALAVIGTAIAGTEPPRLLDAQRAPIALKRRSFSHF